MNRHLPIGSFGQCKVTAIKDSLHGEVAGNLDDLFAGIGSWPREPGKPAGAEYTCRHVLKSGLASVVKGENHGIQNAARGRSGPPAG